MASKFNKWDKMQVVWEDSYHTSGWHPLSNVDTVTEDSLDQMTIGYFVGESPRTISLAQSAKYSTELRAQEDTYVDSVLTIPRKAILSIVKLEGAGNLPPTPNRLETR